MYRTGDFLGVTASQATLHVTGLHNSITLGEDQFGEPLLAMSQRVIFDRFRRSAHVGYSPDRVRESDKPAGCFVPKQTSHLHS